VSTLTPAATGRGADRDDRAAAAQLGDLVGRLVRMLRRSHVGTLGPASAAALVTVVRSGPLRMGDLAEREGVTAAALSRVVAALERDGLVERSADPGDRRSAFVTASARGRDVVQALRAARAAVLVERISRLSAAERETLLAGLAILERVVGEPAAH
jgi:DNA-binding MarR family transcriptional regulator